MMSSLFVRASIAIALCITLSFGLDGEMVYQKKCASCHQLYRPIGELEKNFMHDNNELLHLKAPTINQIVYRLKSRIGDPNGDSEMQQMEIESFLQDYFTTPDKQKSICMPQVLAFFETMPAISLSEEEFEAIVAFLMAYDPKRYETSKMEYQGYQKALENARQNHKPVMVFFSATHCGYCKKMEDEVLSNSEVIEAIAHDFIPVTVDLDKEKNPSKENIKMTPTFLFLTPEQKTLYTVPGSWNKEDFLEILKEAQKRWNTSQIKGAKQ